MHRSDPSNETPDIRIPMKPEALAKVVATIPVGRLGEADEIARGVLFLVQDPGFMNGSTLTMNGSQYIAG